MTEHTMMTAAELAEFRAWLNRRAPYNPDDEEFLPVRAASLYGLLATVDALTERAEQAEAERDTAVRRYEEIRQAPIQQQLDEALAAVQTLTEKVERSDRERDELKSYCSDLEKQGDDLAGLLEPVCNERDEALALADARGRALSDFQTVIEDALSIAENAGESMILSPWDDLKSVLKKHAEALSLPAPEALRQQQEREAELVARIEELEGALAVSEYHRDKAAKQAGRLLRAKPIHRMTPQALAQQQEYIAALEKVAKVASEALAAPSYYWEEAWNEVSTALEAIDATKGGQA